MKQTQSILSSIITCLALGASAAFAADAPADPKWESSAALGLTLTRGNSDTLMLNGNVQSAKKWDQNEVNLGADATYGEDNGERNAQSARIYGQYNRLFTERAFGYLRLEGLHDDIADVDYRFIISPGVGYYFIKNETTGLRAEVGPGFIYERQGGRDRGYFTLRLAERLDHKLNERSKIWQSVEILPQVDDWENFIVNAELGIETAITKRLSQRTYIQDTYDNQPAPGREENDLKLIAGLAYKF